MLNAATRTSVHVRFDISESGSVSVTLLGSTGNAELDSEVLSTLRRWRFSPALRDGVPYASSQRLRVEFLVSD